MTVVVGKDKLKELANAPLEEPKTEPQDSKKKKGDGKKRKKGGNILKSGLKSKFVM